MKEFAEKFYGSQQWKDCRAAYAASVGNLCERCLKAGMITPGEIVHHKIKLTQSNVSDPSITLNFINLEYLCRFHHAEAHSKSRKRYKVDELGRVIVTK